MSAIAGVCYWDGRPVPPELLTTLSSHLEAAGPHGGGVLSPRPGLALKAHVLHFDSVSRQERQPLAFAQGSVATFDGRLDNRSDLLASLHHDLGDDTTDTALVAAAFERWGFDAFRRLIGDWSVAIWDGSSQRLILARDYMANRPLYYLELPGGLAWASRIDALADAFALYGSPSEAYIAGTLTGHVPADMTAFTGVTSLRGGCALLAHADRPIAIQRYWTFEPSTIRYRNKRDYDDHIRDLLLDSVRVRLRTDQRVWSHLSGGMDSSSVVCIANALIAHREVAAPSVQPLSLVIPSSPESDESPFISAVERWCGLTTFRLEAGDPPLSFQRMMGRRYPLFNGRAAALEEPVTAAGDRIVMTGLLGDSTMFRSSSSVSALLEPLHEGRPLETLRLCFSRARHRRLPLLHSLVSLAYVTYFGQHYYRGIVRRLELAEARARHESSGDRSERLGVTPALLAHAPLQSRSPAQPLEAFPRLKRLFVETQYHWADGLGKSDEVSAPSIWQTHPFSHRPLVEFILGIPQLVMWDPLAPSAGVKRVLTDILPPEILARASKGDPSVHNARADVRRIGELGRASLPDEPPREWQLVTRGYVRQDRLERELASLSTTWPSHFFTQCLHFEAWLRTLSSLSVPRVSYSIVSQHSSTTSVYSASTPSPVTS